MVVFVVAKIRASGVIKMQASIIITLLCHISTTLLDRQGHLAIKDLATQE
jgi:hypothetical protein